MKYYTILKCALIVPQERRAYHPIAVGAGTVVRLIPPDEYDISNVSSTTACKNEPYVEYADSVGRLHRGWLARTVAWRQGGHGPVTYMPYDPTDPLSHWDRLREVLASQGWTMPHWISTMKAADRNLARAIIRELGGTVPKTKRNDDFKPILLRLTQAHTKEDRMAGKTKAKAAAPAKAEASEKNEPRSNSAMASAAAALTELKVKHPAIGKLEAGKCSSASLAELRDHINELAFNARENNKPSRASKLSALNRVIRKLQRKAAAA